MQIKHYTLLGMLSLALCGCKQDTDDNVVSQSYIHKYGYAISQEEWEAKSYPGQVITYLRNGVTVTATYENDILHGPWTSTFPSSQIVQEYCLYNQGTKVKEVLYAPTGMPVIEKVQLSESRIATTLWYEDGVPMQIEEHNGDELVQGQYLTPTNEVESRVAKGKGMRMLRDAKGELLAKEIVEEGYAVKRESFYPNGTPESIASCHQGTLNGEKKSFAPTGEPIAIEHYANNQLHGKAIYYNNGNKYLEVNYRFDQKNGLEKHFTDGNILSQETYWEAGAQHGPSIFYVENKKRTEWFYAGKNVSRAQFEELHELDVMISHASPNAADFENASR